jgi:hypothetical protein
MRLGKFVLTLGLFSIVWSLVRLFYKGNMVLYNVFAGVALLVVFSIAFSILTKKVSASKKHGITLGIFSFIAITSDPLSIYPLFITALFLLLIDFALVRNFAISFLVLTGVLIGYFLISGSTNDFINQAFHFNATVYDRYLETNPFRFLNLLQFSLSGLGIAKPIWWDFAPMRSLTGGYDHINRWFFTGFIYRFSIIVVSINLAVKKKYAAAGYIYLFAASMLVMNEADFRSVGFAMVAIFVMLYLVIENFGWPKLSSPLFFIYKIGVISVISLSLLFLVYRTGSDIWENRSKFDYAANFRAQEIEAEELLKKSCNNPNVLLAYYPGHPNIYWFTNLKPVSKYVYFWPWVADIGQGEVISILEDPDTQAIVYIADAVIWETYPTAEYLQPLIEFLDENYPKSGYVFISPNLLSCQTE